MKIDSGRVGTELQETLVELLDLANQAKQAHWNVVGPQFRPVHLQLDDLTDDLRAAADLIAERAVAIGYHPDGRTVTIVRADPLPSFPAGQVSVAEVLELITDRLELITERMRERIDDLAELDLVSQDIVTGALATLDKHRWMFAAQRA